MLHALASMILIQRVLPRNGFHYSVRKEYHYRVCYSFKVIILLHHKHTPAVKESTGTCLGITIYHVE